MTVDVLVQKNYTTDTPTTYTETQNNEATVDSDGSNIPTAYMIERPWVLTDTVSLSSTIGSNPVSYLTDYNLEKSGNNLIIVPLTVWDAASDSANAVTYDYLATHVPGNEINDSFKDIDYYYLATNKGLSVIKISDEEIQGWVERDEGYTCVHGIGNYIYLGTEDAGIYYVLKSDIDGLITDTLAYSTGTSPTIGSNNVKDIMSVTTASGTTLLIGTSSSCDLIYGAGPTGGTKYTRSGYSKKVYLRTSSLYHVRRASNMDSVEVVSPLPTANWGSSTQTFNMSSAPVLNYNQINNFHVTHGTSVSRTGDTIFIGYLNRGLDVLSIDEDNYSNSDVDHLENQYNTPYVAQAYESSKIRNLYEDLNTIGGTKTVTGSTSSVVRDGNLDIVVVTRSSTTVHLYKLNGYDPSIEIFHENLTNANYYGYQLCIDSNNDIFIGYTVTDKIRKYSGVDGSYLSAEVAIGKSAHFVNILPNDNISVLSNQDHTLRVISNDLTSTIGSDTFSSVYTARSTCVDNLGYTWVWAERASNPPYLFKFDYNGNYAGSISGFSSTYRNVGPCCIDSNGYLWLLASSTTTPSNARIYKIDPVSNAKILNEVNAGALSGGNNTAYNNTFYFSGGDDGYVYVIAPHASNRNSWYLWKIDPETGVSVDDTGHVGYSAPGKYYYGNGDLTGLIWQRFFGPGRKKPFMGNSNNVTTIKTSSTASRDTGVIYIGTSSTGSNRGAFTKLRLSDKEVLNFVEFKESSTLEVV